MKSKVLGGGFWGMALVLLAMPFIIALCTLHMLLRWCGYYKDNVSYY